MIKFGHLMTKSILTFSIFLATYFVGFSQTISSITKSKPGVCPGTAVGLKVVATGGTSPYTYSWSPTINIVNPNLDSVVASPTATTIYTVVVTDATNATVSSTISVSLFAGVVSPLNIRHANCFLSPSATIKAKPTSGTAPYSISVIPAGGFFFAGVTDSITFLAAGNYTTTVTDANGCTVSSSVTLTQPSPVNATITPIQPTCFGLSNGGGVVVGSGGKPYLSGLAEPYNVVWYTSVGFTQLTSGDSVTSLPAGTYNVFVTDSNNCNIYPDVFKVVTVTNPTRVVSTPTVSTPIACAGASNGVVTVVGSGGTVGNGYTYAMNTGTFSSTNTFSSLAAGTYTFKTRDGNNCQKDSVITISAPTVGLSANAIVNSPINCFGGSGSYSVSAVGGTAPFTGTGIISNILAGSYTVSITDANLCSATTTVQLSQPTAITLATSITNPACFGANGTISATATGGTGAKTVQVNSQNLPLSLAAGTYTIVATDNNLCSVISSVSVIEPSAISLTTSVINPTCPGSNGSISFSANGGTGTINYTVNGTIATSPFLTMTAGNYTIQATDANNCSTSSIVTLSAAPPSSVTVSLLSKSNNQCSNSNDGLASVIAANGLSPYSYSTMPATSSNGNGIMSGLSGGIYTIVAQDANSCTGTVTVEILTPTAISFLAPVATQASFCNLNDGAVSVFANGGTGSKTYAIMPIKPQIISGTFSSLDPQTYTITATDASNCTATITQTINSTTPMTVSEIANISPSCFGRNNGAFNVSSIGGTPGYTYSVTPAAVIGASGAFLSAAANTYTVIAKDARNCTTTIQVVVTQPTDIVILPPVVTSPSCNGSANGAITVNAINGTGTKTYALTPTGLQPVSGTFANLTSKIYAVLATDANGCTKTRVIVVGQPSLLKISSISKTNNSCFGGANGTLTATTNGGAGSKTLSLSPAGNAVNATTFNNLAAATYTLTATDANSCTKTSTTIISQPSQITFYSPVVSQPTTGNNGAVQVSAIGGVGAKQYAITPGGSQNTTGNFANLSNGTYTFTATDANSCTSTMTVILGSGVVIVNSENSTVLMDYNITLYPNPTDKESKISLTAAKDEQITITTLNAVGSIVGRIEYLSIGGTQEINLNVESLPSGLYFVKITSSGALNKKLLLEKR